MGKRQRVKFAKRPRDAYYTTDPDAAKVLAPYVDDMSYVEPCAGGGDLVMGLKEFSSAHCAAMYDIEPHGENITQKNCVHITEDDLTNVDLFITNPPFSWTLLRPVLDHLPKLRPTWLLLPADVMHNVRMSPYMQKCQCAVSVGRLSWMDNGIKGVDNYCWLLFTDMRQETIFVPRL